MRILIGHNYYQWYGGEDVVFKAECELLRGNGHEVFTYERSNKEIDSLSLIKKAGQFLSLSWSKKSYQEIIDLIRKVKPDIAHFHNTHFMITPSAYSACQQENVPVVQTLHNFRWVCANALLYRENKVCEDCLNKTRWEAVKNKCYRNSYLLSGIMVNSMNAHWKKKTWIDKINGYIVPTDFVKRKFIQQGLSTDKIYVKPNFIFSKENNAVEDDGYALYIGRLSEEKGINFLVQAWKSLPGVPLKILGDGPLKKDIQKYINENNLKNIELMGFIDSNSPRYNEVLSRAKCIVVPSLCYETFSRVIIEAMSLGVPVVASRLGSPAELIEERKTGYLFEPGDSKDLAEKLSFVFNQNSLRAMRDYSIKVFNEKYAAQKNYSILYRIYESIIDRYSKERLMHV